jgi:transcriptional regulator with XRE-family HTH domain
MQESGVVRPNAALGDFLRSRRARLDPGEAGLISTRRRRVEGLRREELAALAGMSVDYYTRLEQGRHASASPGVLDAIARALRLPEADRAYLHRLAEPAPRKTETPAVVRPETRHLIQALDPAPAALLGYDLSVLAVNRAARVLFTDYEALPPGERNAVHWMLTDPAARELHGDDWTAIVSEMIGIMRLRTGRKGPRGETRRLVDELLVSNDLFRRVWNDQTVSLADRSRKRLRHPRAGLVEFGVESLQVRYSTEQVLVVLTPEPGSESERAWHEVMAATA